MNKFIATGNLTRDPELIYYKDKACLKFSIANNEGWGDNKKTNFFDVSVWGKTAESLQKLIRKGSKVLVQGRIENFEFNDKTTGEIKKGYGIVADNFCGIEILTYKDKSESTANSEKPAPDLDAMNDNDMPF